MTHKFDPRNCGRLDNPERRKILPPEETLRALGLKAGDVFVDIGCGLGYFTIPALRVVGSRGKVFGLDTSERMLDEFRARATEDELRRIVLIRSGEYTLDIEPRSATFAFMANVLHEIEDHEAFIEGVREVLVPSGGGKLAIIEWQKRRGEHGPPVAHRLDRGYVERVLEGKGFLVTDKRSIGQDYYAIVSLKNGSGAGG
jgi:ubiquinone/menaquinone biosynthesis C-methylase UbiE